MNTIEKTLSFDACEQAGFCPGEAHANRTLVANLNAQMIFDTGVPRKFQISVVNENSQQIICVELPVMARPFPPNRSRLTN